MNKLLSKLVNARKRKIRLNRIFVRGSVSLQIAKMGQMGQSLVVASR